MATDISPHRFTVTDYHRMAEAGILTEDDRVELIDGEIMDMSPIGGPHMECVNRLNQLLVGLVPRDTIVSVQNPVRLARRHEPQPDFAVIRDRQYGGIPPSPTDVLLLIEVSDTTIRFDRSRKLPLYARAGIPEAWLIDLGAQALERHTNPVDGTYRMTVRVGRGEAIESLAIPGLVFKVDEVLG